MSTPARSVIFLVDPVKARRDEQERALRLRFTVRTFATPEEARAAAAAEPPQAVVLSIRQAEGNGVVAAKALRAAIGPRPFVLVHGAADQPMNQEQRQVQMQRHGVDSWLTRPVDTHTLEVVLWNEVVIRFVPKAPRAEAPTAGERMRATAAEVKTTLTRHHHLLPNPEPAAPGEEPSWLELLNAPVSAESVRRLFQKPLRLGAARRTHAA